MKQNSDKRLIKTWMLLAGGLGLMIQGLMAQEMGEPILHWSFDHSPAYHDMEHDASGHDNDGIVRWDKIRSVGGFQWRPDAGVYGGAGYGDAGCLQSVKPIT